MRPRIQRKAPRIRQRNQRQPPRIRWLRKGSGLGEARAKELQTQARFGVPPAAQDAALYPKLPLLLQKGTAQKRKSLSRKKRTKKEVWEKPASIVLAPVSEKFIVPKRGSVPRPGHISRGLWRIESRLSRALDYYERFRTEIAGDLKKRKITRSEANRQMEAIRAREKLLRSKAEAMKKVSLGALFEFSLKAKGLTLLLDDSYFRELVERVISREKYVEPRQRAKLRSTMVYIDIDKLKKLNDTIGHELGTDYLHVFERALDKVVQQSNLGFVCRHGGDELVIFAPVSMKIAAEMIQMAAKQCFTEIDAQGFPPNTRAIVRKLLSFTAGMIERSPESPMDYRTMINYADFLMNAGKGRAKGVPKPKGRLKGQIAFYDENGNVRYKRLPFRAAA